jgi:hypothetical protein
MKIFSKLFTAIAICGLLLAIVLSIITPEANAQALIPPTKYAAFDNVPSIIEGSATSNVVSTAINVRPGKGITIWPLFAGTNSGTANLICKLAITRDGTNWSTTTLNGTNAMNGTTGVLGFFTISAEQLQGAKELRLQSMQNLHTASLFITNVNWSVSNH